MVAVFAEVKVDPESRADARTAVISVKVGPSSGLCY
jgi:hypothetical protein